MTFSSTSYLLIRMLLLRGNKLSYVIIVSMIINLMC